MIDVHGPWTARSKHSLVFALHATIATTSMYRDHHRWRCPTSLRGSLVAAAKLLTSRAIPYADLRAPAGARGRREGRSAATDT